MSSLTEKQSFWYCDGCHRTLMHGEYRYNCTVCEEHDYCEQCMATISPPHSHRMVRELAYGCEEERYCARIDMATGIRAAMAMYWDRHCMGVRDIDQVNPENYADSYSWLTFKEVGNRSKNFGHGLRRVIEPRGHLGICAANRPEWIMTDFACIFQCIISVPIYCLFNDHDATYIINNTQISVIVCDKEMLPKFIRLHSKCPTLRHIVCMDPIPETIARNDRLSIHYMKDIERHDSIKQYDSVTIEPDDCLTIFYTSGSSGFPKGAIISEKAFRGSFPRWCSPFSYDHITFSYRPLAWAGDRGAVVHTFLGGGRTAFSTGDVSQLMEELAIVRPSQFSGPPTVWNKIYSEFKTALSLVAANRPSDAIAKEEERLLKQFSKLIPKRCRVINVGGAMVSPVVMKFMQRCFAHCAIHESYGATECGSVAYNNFLEESLDYRLESVPEMGYTVDDKPYPRGEILAKTVQMFSGYVNNPEETRAALTEDGFFRTGDIVELRPKPNGTSLVHVIDRKKNFFKLSQGQFVSPEFLEGIYIKSPFVEQIYIHGDLLADSVAAVVVPNRQYAEAFIAEHNLKQFDMSNPDPQLYDAVMRDLRSIAAEESLRKHEIPSRLFIDFEPFTPKNGLLTSSLKPCRPKLASYYAVRFKISSNSIEQRLKTIIETATGRSLMTNEDEDVIAAGGDSLTAVRLSRMIQNDLGVPLPVHVLFQPKMNIQRLAMLVQDPSQISSFPESVIPQMLHDAELELGITIGKRRTTDISPSTVFITGATGYVGAFLLAELLIVYPSNCKFVCLVRCKPLTDPLDRIRTNMSFLCLWKDEFRDRIIALRGDLNEVHFALDIETYESLAAQTDIIFHCGATVNFVLPYNKLYGPNVCGTREIIRLAAHARTCIPVQYISTVSVLSPDISDEIPIDEISPDRLTSGYAQSKWVAEKLVAKAIRSGLPVVTYRLGSICANTKTGACNQNDLHTMLMAAIMKIGCYPTAALDSRWNGLPANFTAKSIVYLSRMQPDVYGSIYHVSNSHSGVPFKDIIEGMQKCGVQLKNVSFAEWRTKMKAESMQNSPFESLGEFLSPNVFMEKSTVSSKRFCSAVSGLDSPCVDKEYVFKWVSFIFHNIVKW